MNVKVLALILTTILFVLGICFLVKNYETCYTCNAPVASETFPEVHNRTDIYFAILNFVFAMISAYFITIKKFKVGAIVSGAMVGLQAVAFGMLFF